MSVIAEIHSSLDAVGFEQQVCMFVFLSSYPLVLGRLLEGRGRRIAAGMAIASATGFALFTDPWFHAVLLTIAVIACFGLLIAAVCIFEQVQRIALHGATRPAFVEADTVSIANAGSTRGPAGMSPLPLHTPRPG
jgi:hypothetical protein